MCCFSGPVKHVADTRIFARSVEKGRQLLAYSMAMAADSDIAMILPLPVPAGSPDDALRFISLKEYPDFFEDLRRGFPEPISRNITGAKSAEAAPTPKPQLAVVEVGSFEASFVPTVRDFGRLDARFRLPDAVWASLPAYKDFGFAVFKFKKDTRLAHPMAFEFPRADPAKVFFPTVHIHDGAVHDKAGFDHVLYCQKREGDKTSLPEWRESDLPAARFLKVDRAQGLVDGASHCYQRFVKGERKNEDILA